MRFLIYGATKGRGDGIGHSTALALKARGHEVFGLCRDAEKAAAERDLQLEAVDIMVEAIERRTKSLSFPWQLATVVRLTRLLPRGAYDWIASRVDRRKDPEAGGPES